MNRENQLLVTDEPVEFEKQPAEVQDIRKITNHFRGNFRVYLRFTKESWKMSTCNLLVGLGNTVGTNNADFNQVMIIKHRPS